MGNAPKEVAILGEAGSARANRGSPFTSMIHCLLTRQTSHSLSIVQSGYPHP